MNFSNIANQYAFHKSQEKKNSHNSKRLAESTQTMPCKTHALSTSRQFTQRRYRLKDQIRRCSIKLQRLQLMLVKENELLIRAKAARKMAGKEAASAVYQSNDQSAASTSKV